MGNCQAAEAVAVLIQHPGGNKVERIHWSVSAAEIMNSNPGHYVAQVVTSPAAKTPAKQLKLLRPDDTLVVGQVYRLISFEDVLKGFNTKKCVKLGKLLKERGGIDMDLNSQSASTTTAQHEVHHLGSSGSDDSGKALAWRQGGGGQWRPTLQSISELGSI